MTRVTVHRPVGLAGMAFGLLLAGTATPAAAQMYARVMAGPPVYGYSYPYPCPTYYYYPYYYSPPLVAYPATPPPGFAPGHWEEGRDPWGQRVTIWVPLHLR